MANLSKYFTRLLGVDLGTSRTRIWVGSTDTLVDEPSCVAVDNRTKKVLAVGNDAYEMRGRVGKEISVHFPIKKGVVYDADIARAMLKVMIERAAKTSILSPVVMVSIPATVTPVGEKIVSDLFYSLGSKEVYTINQPLAAAIGAGVPVADASGSCLLQMGAGVVEGVVISLGSVVHREAAVVASGAVDQRIALSLRKNHEVQIGMTTAQYVKEMIGSITDTQARITVSGKDVLRSAPQEIAVTSQMIQGPLLKTADSYDRLLKKLLMKTPPELTVDIIDKGLLLAGGWAQLHGWEDFFIDTLGVPVSVVDDPDTAVIRGIQAVLQHLDLFKDSLGYEI